MNLFGRKTDDADLALRAELLEQLAGLRADIKVLSKQKDRTADLHALEERIETLKREKARHDEERATRERTTEHKVGLLLERQEQDLAAARRETELTVREGNLSTERAAFEKQMTFRDERWTEEMARMHELQQAILERLPKVKAMFRNNGGRHEGED
jgi:uncharacterized protein (DUF342 family)